MGCMISHQLEKMEAFVLEHKSFAKLSKDEIGHFSSHSCYVFLCTQVGLLASPTVMKIMLIAVARD